MTGSRALLVAALALIGAGLVATGSTTGELAQPATSSCLLSKAALSEAAMIQNQDIGTDFVTMGDSVQSSPPIGFERNPIAAGFVGGRVKGFLATVALADQYRAEETARERALNYPTGKWPLLPLEGSVVADNSGPLEVYQANWVFRSPADAGIFLSDAVASIGHAPSPTAVKLSAIHLGRIDDVSGWLVPSRSIKSERNLSLDIRISQVVMQLTVRGGHELSPAYGVGLARVAVNHFWNACVG